jgi:hypothetical protein
VRLRRGHELPRLRIGVSLDRVGGASAAGNFGQGALRRGWLRGGGELMSRRRLALCALDVGARLLLAKHPEEAEDDQRGGGRDRDALRPARHPPRAGGARVADSRHGGGGRLGRGRDVWGRRRVLRRASLAE